MVWFGSYRRVISVILPREMPQIIFLSNINYIIIPYQPICGYKYPDMQCRKYCVNIPMDVFCNINALMVQLGTSCSFDSPGLARNEPTPGKRLQGDSTP